MGAETEQPVPAVEAETSPSPATSRKRKSADQPEIEVDLSLPVPPSKRAKRALKKGKALPPKRDSDDDEADAADKKGQEGKDTPNGKKPKKERSPHGVWIGNLRFTVTKDELRRWLVDNSGGAITEELITRVHLPASGRDKDGSRRPKRDEKDEKDKAVQNRGFAYVDFATYDANVAAIALSETEWHGRHLLIKDNKSFEGRPKKDAEVNGAGATTTIGTTTAVSSTATTTTTTTTKPAGTKVFVGNLGFDITEDDLWSHFDKCGEIDWVKVATFEDSGKCKGYAWIRFKAPDAAAHAVAGFVKIKETEPELEDFVEADNDNDNDNEAGSAARDDKEGSGEEGAEEHTDGAGQEEEEDTTAEKKTASGRQRAREEPRKTRTRKWWVNTLHGRRLKIEMAEDDALRYKKRFGRGARPHDDDNNNRARSGQGGHKAGIRDNNGDEGKKKAETTGKASSSSSSRNPAEGARKFQDDVGVARLTGAAVAPQGSKITFE